MPLGGIGNSGGTHSGTFLVINGLKVRTLRLLEFSSRIVSIRSNLFLPICVPFLVNFSSVSVHGIVRLPLLYDTMKHDHRPYWACMPTTFPGIHSQLPTGPVLFMRMDTSSPTSMYGATLYVVR
jgi:hypothetical protein